MCPPNIVLCFVLLLVASFSKSQENSTNDNERSDYSTMRYEHFVSSMKYQNNEMETTQCNSCENSIKNDNEIQYESINSTKNDHKNNDSMRYESHGHTIKNHEGSNQMSMEPRANLIEINSTLQEINENLRKKAESENNSTNSNEFYKDSNTDDFNNNTAIVVPYEACHNVTCIQLCCPYSNILTIQGRCVAGQNNYTFPSVFTYSNDFEGKRLDELFPLTVRDPCVLQGRGRNLFKGYIFLVNGSLFQGPDKLVLPTSYCLAVIQRNIYDVIVCNDRTKFPIYLSACLLVSLPFLLLTFVVYSILPELQNMHGYTLRAHVASLFITYVIMYFGQQNASELVEWRYCVPMAYIFNFSFLSSFFWLNVTCFDIWWTFRGKRSYQTSKKEDKKKFVMYSLYAWGITLILNIICVIMDYAPGIPKNLIRPEMCKIKFWFSENEAKTIYFYIPMGTTIIINICFFISTMITIMYQNIYTAHQMRDSENKRYNENKQRYNMYLKLFIVMGISWVMELLAWFINNIPTVVWYPTYVINGLQGVIIFVIFVCTKKIKQLLLKKFGGRNCGPFCKIPTYSNSTTSTTSTSASGTLPMQEVNSSN